MTALINRLYQQCQTNECTLLVKNHKLMLGHGLSQAFLYKMNIYDVVKHFYPHNQPLTKKVMLASMQDSSSSKSSEKNVTNQSNFLKLISLLEVGSKGISSKVSNLELDFNTFC